MGQKGYRKFMCMANKNKIEYNVNVLLELCREPLLDAIVPVRIRGDRI